jgi:Arc-like DNA binding domain
MTRRAKQASFVALNLRLPPDLHQELVKAAGSTRSLNAEILERLQASFYPVKAHPLVEGRIVRAPSPEARYRALIARKLKQAGETPKKSAEENRGELEALKRRVERLEKRLCDQKK